jgi:hypothetical protein
MPKKLTHEEFLEKVQNSNKHYRNGEFEVVSDYVNYSTPLVVKDEYGLCKVWYTQLVNNEYKPSILSAIDKTSYFKNELLVANSHYKNNLFEVISGYEGRPSKILVLTKYGICSMDAASLLLGYMPRVESSLSKEDYAFNILKDKNPEIAELVSIEMYQSPKVILNSKYGRLEAHFHSVLGWKELSVRAAIDKNLFWIKRSIDIRKDSDNIDYSKVNYINNENKVTLTCKIHHYEYYQRPSHHTKGIQGCPYCMKKIIKYTDDTIITHKEFIQNINGFLYVMLLYNENESFYKVGIVSANRFNSRVNKLQQYYSVEVKYREELNMVSAYITEQRFLKEFIKYKYTPKINFAGHTECLTINPIEAYYWWEQQKLESNYESEN